MGLLDALLGIGQQAWSNAFTKNENEKNREFQSQEAELNRAFQSEESALQRNWSSQEAERARDWQEEMYSKYNSLSGKIAQAEQAGVNPLFAVTGQSTTPMNASSSAPSGASAGSVATPSGSASTAGLVNILGAVIDARRAKSEAEVNTALANKYNKEAEGQSITNEQLRDMNASEILKNLSQVELNNSNVELVASKVLNTAADTEVKTSQLGLIASQIVNTNADTDTKVQQLAVMASEIVKNNKSVDVMTAQISLMATEAGLNREKGKEIAQSVRNMVQEYGHAKVMNAFEETIADINTASASYMDTRDLDPLSRSVMEFIKFMRAGIVK